MPNSIVSARLRFGNPNPFLMTLDEATACLSMGTWITRRLGEGPYLPEDIESLCDELAASIPDYE